MEIDLFCELATPPMRSHHTSHVYGDLFAVASAADRFGFGALWLPEHHFLGDYSAAAAPDMLLAAVARETTRLRLGFAILPLPIHDPVRVAERLATLDIISGGRVLWGVGRGVTTTELEAFSVEPENSRKIFKERLAELRGILESGRYRRGSQTYDLNPTPAPRLKQGWMAAVSPESFDLAATLELDVLTGPFKPWPMIKADLKRYRCLRPDGKTSFTLALYCEPDHQSARRRAGPGILWAYRRILDVVRPLLIRQVGGYEYYRKLGWVTPVLEKTLTLSVLETLGLAAVGNPDHVTKRIAALRDAGIDRVGLVVGGGDLAASEMVACLELIAAEVMPKLSSTETVHEGVPA